MIHENQLDTGYFRITPLPGLADISTPKKLVSDCDELEISKKS
jgi:hypothetical protein